MGDKREWEWGQIQEMILTTRIYQPNQEAEVPVLILWKTGMCQIWLRNCSLIALFVAGVRGAESASGIRPTVARQPPRALYSLVVVAAATGAPFP